MPTLAGRLSLPYPVLATTPADVPQWLLALATQLEAIAPALYVQGTVRPVSTGGSPGVQGRFFYNTTTGLLSYDYGTGWLDLGTVTQQYVDDAAFSNALIFGG